MTGKLGPEALATVLDATGVDDPTVLQGAAYGEDAAAIDLGDRTLVVSTDPLSLAADAVGRLAVHVACNDVAASGADPRWLTNTVLLPDDDPDRLRTVADQVDETARSVGVTVVSGHTEVVPSLERPLLSMTAFGTTDRFLPSGGVEPGDRILLTGGAGVEATGILATDFREACRDAGVDEATLHSAEGFLDDVSVIDDARALRGVATALHDPTEGGVLTGLVEMATASGLAIETSRESIPVRPETAACCAALDVDPLATFGSGALLAAVPEAAVGDALAALDDADIDGGVIGTAVPPVDTRSASEGLAPGTVLLDGDPITEPPRDELYPCWE